MTNTTRPPDRFLNFVRAFGPVAAELEMEPVAAIMNALGYAKDDDDDIFALRGLVEDHFPNAKESDLDLLVPILFTADEPIQADVADYTLMPGWVDMALADSRLDPDVVRRRVCCIMTFADNRAMKLDIRAEMINTWKQFNGVCLTDGCLMDYGRCPDH